jgi:DNA-binding GntR family transcriptional regulator
VDSQGLDAVLALPESRSLSVEIAGRLRSAILTGHFGPGEQLREEPIARSMGVSRGPVREAFVRLEREGLVLIRRNRGAFVAQLARQDLDEVYTLRVAIERLAVQLAVRRADASTHRALQDVVDRMAATDAGSISEQEAAELDVRFHDLIYRAAAHRRLYDAWTALRLQIHILLLNRNVADDDFRVYLVVSHQEILDAVRDRDEARALALIEEHLRGSYERVRGSYTPRDGGDGVPAPDDLTKGSGDVD